MLLVMELIHIGGGGRGTSSSCGTIIFEREQSPQKIRPHRLHATRQNLEKFDVDKLNLSQNIATTLDYADYSVFRSFINDFLLRKTNQKIKN